MKPCFGKRKRIALLVLGALDAGQADALRAHLNACRACHEYWNELAVLCRAHRNAAEIAPEIEPSPVFHQRLANRIRNEASPRFRRSVSLNPWRWVGRWRVAIPSFALLVCVGFAFIAWLQQDKLRVGDNTSLSSGPNVEAETYFSPTFSSYRAAANSSLETLDDLLVEQPPLKATSDRPLTVAASRIEMDE